jgi:biuret amidohydrolase
VKVDAEPYRWPADGQCRPVGTALMCIDFQGDFCEPGGYLDALGYDLRSARAPLLPAALVLAAARGAGMPVVHTREGYAPDLSDCPPSRLWRSKRAGAGIGALGPIGRALVRGEPCWEIVEEMAPLPGEWVIDKPGAGAFYTTELDLVLRCKGLKHLVFMGLRGDVGVNSVMREASDRGYNCLLLSDCAGATQEANHLAAAQIVKLGGGVFGAVTTSTMFLPCLEPAA